MENAEKERISKVSFRFVPTRREIENPKKIAKKFKNLKNAILASFQAKTGWKRLRMRENKNYRSVPFLLVAKLKITKKSNKIENIKIYHYGFISSQNRM